MQPQLVGKVLQIFALCLVVLTIGACNIWRANMRTGQEGDPGHHLPRTMVERLFDEAPTLHVVEGDEELSFFCIALEGSQCYYVSDDLVATFDFRYNPDIETPANQIDRDFAREILRELDVKHVERAKNNTVLLNCRRDGAGSLSCTVNGGTEPWYPVRLD